MANEADSAVLESAPSAGGAPPATDPACLDQTSSTLEQHGLATPDELQQLYEHGLAPLRGPRPWDPLEFLAALRVRDPDARPVEVERIGRALSQAMGQQLALVPFANRFPLPSTFYENNGKVMSDCERLMTPVLYAEEMEVVGIGSINPVALRQMENILTDALSAQTGAKPIVTKVLMHHEGWISLCQKQFGI